MTSDVRRKPRAGIYLLFVVALLAGGAYAVFAPNTGDMHSGKFLYIHTGADLDQVVGGMESGGFIMSGGTFKLLASVAGLGKHVKPGKYLISKGMSNYKLVRLLRLGHQTPVKLVINKVRTKREFVQLLCSNLEADSTQLYQILEDDKMLSAYHLSSETALCAVLPDTYEFFWNTSADKAFKKIAANFHTFWTPERRAKADARHLTVAQVVTVASIVEEETNVAEDKPLIASVYLNREAKGMKLQADPTVKFALGDFTIRRITGPMLTYPSPYNTYLNDGLPPGPICTPSPATINAVLDAPETKYLYFCAKADFSGSSAFAKTFDEQKKNAVAYQHALNARGIK